MSERLPVTVVTGFLGSGKTTLLRYLLTHSNQRLAVIVNEFGSVGLDGDLIKSCGFCKKDEMNDRIVELNNGCLCCTVQEEFLPTMEKLLSHYDQLDGIVVETSGLALPRPLLQALEWPEIRSKVHINGVVTLLDGEALSKGSLVSDLIALETQREDDSSLDHITPVEELFEHQLSAADIILVSRADIISSEEFVEIKNKIILKATEGTKVLPIKEGKIEPSIVLGLKSLSKSFKVGAEHDDDHKHIKIYSALIRIEADFKKEYIEEILPKLVIKYNIVRLKGRCWIEGKILPLQIQMVGPRLTSWYESVPAESWRPGNYGLEFVTLSFNEGIDNCVKETILNGI